MYQGSMVSAVNVVGMENGIKVDFYRHDFQQRGAAWVCFYYFTKHGGPAPRYPTNKNAMEWMEERVSKRTPGNRSYPISLLDEPETEPKAKKQKLPLAPEPVLTPEQEQYSAEQPGGGKARQPLTSGCHLGVYRATLNLGIVTSDML